MPQINSPSAFAQSIVPAADGTNTQVIPNRNEFNIQGGQLSGDGANLFHSFEKFGLSEGQIANFLSNPNIRNIIGRINGGEASLINGLIQVLGGNSNLYLMNPAGIIFGANAQLNVPAAFTATTSTGIGFGNNNWFNAVGENNWSVLVGTPNEFRFDNLNPGSIVNFGNLAVGTGESLTLLGGNTINLGTLEAPGGRITIAAIPGRNVIRISQAGHLLSIELPLTSESETGIRPLSLPQLLTGGNVGNANAISVNQQGQVVLTGSGIAIPNQAGTAIVSGIVSSSSQQAVGGEVNILGSRIAVIDAHINASGANGGGNIFIGGNRSGLGDLPNAQYTFISPDSVVAADAWQRGNGGQIIVFAQDTAQVYGTLTARGGVQSGNGGFIETSGMRSLTITTVPNVGAPAGLGGEWLIDPYNITIVAGSGNTNIDANSPFEPSGNNAQLGVDLIKTALDAGNVTISTGNSGGQAGDITWNAPLTFNLAAERTLTLNADNDIAILQSIQGTANSAPLNLVFNANNRLGIIGNPILNSAGGDISLTARGRGSNPNLFPVMHILTGTTINTGGGNLTITSTATSPNTIAVSFDNSPINVTGNGNITFNGSSSDNPGVFITGGQFTVENGNITINGTGKPPGHGILLNNATRLTATGNGNIRFNVSDGGGRLTIGDGSQLTVNNGAITLSGTGGMFLNVGSSIQSTTGAITINNSDVIFINNGSSIQSTTGAITLASNNDIFITDSRVQSTSGVINITGTDLIFLYTDSIIQSTSGAINLSSNEVTLSDININPTPGSGNITLKGDEINLLGTTQIRGTGTIRLQPLNPSLGITIGGSFENNDLNLDNSKLANLQNNGFSQIIIGSSDNTGTITLDPNATFNIPVNIAGGATLVGANRNTDWTITGSNSGSISGYANGFTFNNIENIRGGTLDDNFVFNDGANWQGTIDGNAGTDTLNYSAFTSNLSVNLANLGATGIETVIGTNNATSTLIGTNTNNNWNLTGTNSGTVNNILSFRNFQNLVGGTLDDNFVFNDGVNWGGTIAGNTGTDTLDYSAFTTPLIVDVSVLGATGIEIVIGTNNATSTLIGSYTNNNWNIASNNSGTLNNTLNFIQFQNLVGGLLDDNFIFRNGVNWSGVIDGNAGNDTLDYSSSTIPINIDLSTFNAISIETIIGTNNATSTLIAPDFNNTWNIITSNSGRLNYVLNFRNFQRLIGGRLDDNFILANGVTWGGIIHGNQGINTLDYSAFTVPVTVDLNAIGINNLNINNIIGTTNATSTIIGNNDSNTWAIAGNNSGRFNNNINFSNFQRLVGGNLNDEFVFNDGINWNGTIDGSSGTDTLNYANFTSNLVVNLQALTATSIENIIGTNNATSTLMGRNTPNNWNIAGNNSGTYNGTLSFSQFQNLTGGTEADTFNFTPAASISGNIDGGAGNLTLIGDEINFFGTVSGTGDLRIEPSTVNQAIQVGGTDSRNDSVLELTSAEISLLGNGFRSITIGRTDGSGRINLAGDATFQDPVTLQTLGSITYTGGTLRGADNATITVTAQGNITTGSIVNSGRAISLTSQQGQINTTAGIVDASSGTGDGGAIDLTTPANITTGNLNSNSTTNRGGNITLTSQTGTITTGNLNSSGVTSGGNIILQAQTAIATGEINSSATIGNGGNVTLDPIGDIKVSFINTQGGNNGRGGDVFIESTGGFFRATGSFSTAFSPTGTASISTAGNLGGGSITIRHVGGDETPPIQPFVIGSLTPNGTQSAITTGEFTLSPGESFPRAFNLGNIGLVTDSATLQPQPQPQPQPSAQVDDTEFLHNQKNPPIQSETSDTVPVEIDASVAAIEQVLTREFEAYFGQPAVTPIVTLENIQQRLRQTERETKIKSAVLYIVFSRSNLGTNAALICPSRESWLVRETNLELRQLLCDRSANDPIELILVTGTSEPLRLLIPNAMRQQVLALASEFRGEVTNPYKTRTTSYLTSAQKLYELLIAPVQPTLRSQGITNIMFVPDATLRSLPFAALHDGQNFLIQQYSLALIPSFSLTQPRYINLQKARILGMGAATFREQEPLPFVPVELATITAKLGQNRRFLNESFTLNNLNLQRHQQEFEIIHLATHARFQAGNPDNSYIQLWDNRLLLPQMRQLKWNNPPVELLVLSACQTALGDEQAELGFAGLGVEAGVKSALASLWRANDKGTLGLMVAFYQHLQTAPIRSEAIRQAQIALIEGQVRVAAGKLRLWDGTAVELPETADTDFSHPYFWAAFTLIGNPW
jgi:filamentous hemagglutinin family protein